MIADSNFTATGVVAVGDSIMMASSSRRIQLLGTGPL
jgi:hypothetical protein